MGCSEQLCIPAPRCTPTPVPLMNPCPVALPAAKLDPPTLQSIRSMPPQTDCVTLTWTMTPRNAHMELRCELRYRAPEDPSWGVVSADGGRASPPPLLPVPCPGSCTLRLCYGARH